jgi:hypothetical protein
MMIGFSVFMKLNTMLDLFDETFYTGYSLVEHNVCHFQRHYSP